MSCTVNDIGVKPFTYGHNYRIWKCRVFLHLAAKKLLKVITEEVPNVEEMSNEWKKKDSKAQHIIVQCLDDSHLMNYVKEGMNARDIIHGLDAVYEEKTRMSRIEAKLKIKNLKMQNDKKFIDHLIEYENLIADLNAVGGKLDEDDKCLYLMDSLSEKYYPLLLILKIKYRDLNYQLLREKLLDFGMSLEVRDRSPVSKDSAIDGNKCKQNYNKRRNDFKNSNYQKLRRCYFCGRLNHQVKYCMFKKRYENYVQDQQNNGGRANIAVKREL